MKRSTDRIIGYTSKLAGSLERSIGKALQSATNHQLDLTAYETNE
jgi:hypothetical protein